MPKIWIDTDKQVNISEVDFEWIAERMNTSSSGSVSFTQSAVNRFRRVTGQHGTPTWILRGQMLNAFGKLA